MKINLSQVRRAIVQETKAAMQELKSDPDSQNLLDGFGTFVMVGPFIFLTSGQVRIEREFEFTSEEETSTDTETENKTETGGPLVSP